MTKMGLNIQDIYSTYKKVWSDTTIQDIISNFSQIEKDFLKIYNKITDSPFNNKIIILNDTEIYKKTNWSIAAIKRWILFWKNKIWIREMPIYQIFYELSHEIWHTLKPFLEHRDLHAEETKATLFQYVFSNVVKSSDFNRIDEFKWFEKFRIDHITRENPETYAHYHRLAQSVAEDFNYDFEAWAKYIARVLRENNK